MTQAVAGAVGRWMGPQRHAGHVLRDVVLLLGVVAMLATFVQTLQ